MAWHRRLRSCKSRVLPHVIEVPLIFAKIILRVANRGKRSVLLDKLTLCRLTPRGLHSDLPDAHAPHPPVAIYVCVSVLGPVCIDLLEVIVGDERNNRPCKSPMRTGNQQHQVFLEPNSFLVQLNSNRIFTFECEAA